MHILAKQVNQVTGGAFNNWIMVTAVSVGLAIFLSALRILVPGISLWMYLLPDFALAVVLSFFVSDLFAGMAMDAGGD